MSNLKITRHGVNKGLPKICDIDYRTFVTDVPSGNDCIYIKVKKKRNTRSKGLGMEWDKNHCVLLNLSYGTLRQIPAETRVTPLKAELIVTTLAPHCYHTILKKGESHPDYCEE